MREKDIVNSGVEHEMVLRQLFFDKLLENVEPYAIVSSADGKVLFANARCRSFFNSHGDELTGGSWIKRIIPVAKAAEADKLFKQIKKRADIERFETPVMATPHLEKQCRCTAVPLDDNGSKLYMMLLKETKDASGGALAIRPIRGKAVEKTKEFLVRAIFEASMTADAGTAVHSTRVMSYAVLLARKLKMDAEFTGRLRTAALMHDLGKIAIDKKILLKKSKLTESEYKHIKRHPIWGAELMNMICFLKDITPIVAAHHENFGGGGYPEGLKGEAIPYEARILAVADIFEALTADRPYRKGYPEEQALVIMEEEKSGKLDPFITDVFINMVKSGSFVKDDMPE